MKKLPILFILLLTITLTNCKSLNHRKDSATSQLNNLKSGVLLVRLPKIDAKIKRLKELGKHEKAKKENAFNQQLHTQILMAFDNQYNFSKFYFYYSPDSKEIQKGNLNGNIFDAKKNKITDISFAKENIFYAEFGQVHDQELAVEQNGEIKKIAGVGGSNALVIRNQDGLQPPKPFPYSSSYNTIFKKSIAKSVNHLNGQLHRMQAKMQQRYLKRKARSKEVEMNPNL